MRRKKDVIVPKSRVIIDMLEILKKEKMIFDYEIRDYDVLVQPYYKEGEPVVENFKRVSSSGQRIYVKASDIKPVMNGRGIAIISTSHGLMTGALAKSKSIGGEYICNVW